MYIDIEKNEPEYIFWVAQADPGKMEAHEERIPCQITKIKAKNLQELEGKYGQVLPGTPEWNHIYTIFLGKRLTEDKEACTRLLKEWDSAWQKSPNVLLVQTPESPKQLYKLKNIPEGAAGQEVSLLAEQHQKNHSDRPEKQICETPIDYLQATKQNKYSITLYQVKIENGKMKLLHTRLPAGK